MRDSSRNDKSLSGCQLDNSILEIDVELAVDHIEEFVEIDVFVPVVLPLDDAHTHHRVIDATQRLIEPAVFDGAYLPTDVDDLQRRIFDIESSHIRILRHGNPFGDELEDTL